jgi:protein ImuA
MDAALPQPTLSRLRQDLAALDPSLGPRLGETGRSVALGVSPVDAALGGGLACGALHEFAPAAALHLAAATGFTLAIAARASGDRKEILWVSTDFAALEGGGTYGPGLDLFGLPAARLIVLRVARPIDALWAMEEALRCRALAGVITELTGDGAAVDLTASRRLTLAARDGAGLGLLLRHRITAEASAAATRWEVAAAPGQPDRHGGFGRTRFDLALVKNRRGPCGRWTLTWDHHVHDLEAVSLPLAATPADRSHRAPLVRAG